MNGVFLSGSIPLDGKYKVSPDLAEEIKKAVENLFAAIIPHSKLHHGGAPSIIPTIRATNDRLKMPSNLRIYQSSYFKNPDKISEDVKTLDSAKCVEWKDAMSDMCSSIQFMRKEMFEDIKKYHTATSLLAFFMGGKEGIIEEFRQLNKYFPGTPCFVITPLEGSASTLSVNMLEPGIKDKARLYHLNSYSDITFKDTVLKYFSQQQGA